MNSTFKCFSISVIETPASSSALIKSLAWGVELQSLTDTGRVRGANKINIRNINKIIIIFIDFTAEVDVDISTVIASDIIS